MIPQRRAVPYLAVMKAIYFERFGGPEVLQYGERATPRALDREVLIRVHAAGLNPIDWKMRAGGFRLLVWWKLPMIPGSDVAGVVESVGDRVQTLKPGDRVFAMLSPTDGGGYAEYVVAPETQVVPIPDNVDFASAAATPLAALTSLQALRDRGDIAAGDSNKKHVLINGASGGVGSFAVQMAKRCYGARVTAICSQRNHEFVRGLGADRTLDYQDPFALRAALAEESYDIFFDTVDSFSAGEAKSFCKPGGAYISTIPWPWTVIAGYLGRILPGKRSDVVIVESKGRDLQQIADWMTAGKLEPVIDRSYPLQEASEAQRYSEGGRARGKIVLKVGGVNG